MQGLLMRILMGGLYREYEDPSPFLSIHEENWRLTSRVRGRKFWSPCTFYSLLRPTSYIYSYAREHSCS